jgi:spore coat protein U-like protein
MTKTSRHCRRSTWPEAGAWAVAAIALLAGGEVHALDCTFFTSGVAFGVYDGTLPTPTDSTGSVTLRCTHLGGGAVKTHYTIALSTGSSGTFAQRQLRAGPSVLHYNLFDSATRTNAWGDGTQGSALVAGSLLVNPGNFTVNESVHAIYGRIPAQQSADSGVYSDQILVTLTF